MWSQQRCWNIQWFRWMVKITPLCNTWVLTCPLALHTEVSCCLCDVLRMATFYNWIRDKITHQLLQYAFVGKTRICRFTAPGTEADGCFDVGQDLDACYLGSPKVLNATFLLPKMWLFLLFLCSMLLVLVIRLEVAPYIGWDMIDGVMVPILR